MTRNRIKQTTPWFVVGAFLFPFLVLRSLAATLDDLKNLEIICFVPSHLPQGFKLRNVEITYEEPFGEDGQTNHPLPHYSVESPVATEINLDAVEKNGNEFNKDEVQQDDEWLRCPVPDTDGFMRYRVIESKGNHYKVEYQENGGGTLTTASIIEFNIEKRNIHRDGKPVTVSVLRVTSCNQK
jgi:hypothetical protein